jgi:hypothetical protein
VALWYVPGQGLVDDSQEGVSIPEPGEIVLPNGEKITWGIAGTERLPEYTLPAQFGDTPFQWRPGAHTQEWLPGLSSYAVGYIPQLIDWSEAAQAGTLQPFEREQYEQMRQQAMAIPTRDISQLEAGYPGDEGDWGRYLTPSSPDAGAIMLTLRDKIQGGQATEQERGLYDTFLAQMREQNWRASVPQPSDAFNPLSNEFFLALGALGGAVGGAGAFGAFAPVAGAAGGGAAAASATPSLLGIPTSTLSTLGAIGSYGGMGANLLGAATQQPWLQKLGLALGVGGGLAGGLAGLGNVFSTGVQNVGDVARLASSAGRLTGALGRATGIEPLQQASRYLGLGAQVGQLGGGVASLLGAAQGVSEGAMSGLSPQDLVTQRGGRMSEWDWLGLDLGSGEGYGTVLAPGWDPGGGSSAWDTFTGWGDPYGPGSSGDVGFSGEGSGNWLGTALGALGSVGSFLGKNASWLGPAATGLAGLGGGLLGANASSDAAALQAAALNRGLDLSTAQWLAQQERSAPWVQAGRSALEQLQGVAGQAPPSFQQPGLPGTQPFQYSGPGMPATGFQYTGPGMPEMGFQYTNHFPMQDFTAPTWDELKARDPGIAARLTEAQQGLEASAAARGGALSGPALAALQRQSQALASQEYQPAYLRALGEYQMGYGQDWQQQQEAYQRALAQNQQLYGRQWQQQQTDYERQLAQNQLLYGRGLEQYQLGYGQQLGLNQQDYARQQALYQQQYQQMVDAYNAQRLAQQTQFNQLSNIAGLGQTTIGQLGNQGAYAAQQQGNLLSQLGTAQGAGELGGALSWQRALTGAGNQLPSLLRGLNA